jgi:hypothetical protein
VVAPFARAPRCGHRSFACSFPEKKVSRLREPRVRDQKKEMAGEAK